MEMILDKPVTEEVEQRIARETAITKSFFSMFYSFIALRPVACGGAMKTRETLIIPALLFALLGGCTDSKSYSQPIAYNHNKHIEEVGLSCFACHALAMAHEKASIPNIDYCRNCHENAMTDSKEEEKLVEYIKNDQPIPWIQVYRVPDHAYFSHRRHVSLGKIACQDCHGDVNRMTAPFSKPHVPIKMKFCVDCHEEQQVTTDCAACHR